MCSAFEGWGVDGGWRVVLVPGLFRADRPWTRTQGSGSLFWLHLEDLAPAVGIALKTL